MAMRRLGIGPRGRPLRATFFVIAALLTLGFVTCLTPEASAVGYCTAATGHCDGYIVCVGTQTSYGHLTHCQYGVREPDCTCDPMPEPW